jgi:hypothetical protein
MSATDISSALRSHGIEYKATRNGKFTTTCPTCNGGYLNVVTNHDGAKWYCHHCQEGGGVDLNGRNNKPAGAESFGDLGPIKATYDYRDEAGELLYQVLRFEPIGQPKQLRQRTDPNQEKWSIKGVRRIPYRLSELLEAVGQGQIVFIVEGEKKVEALRQRGVVATCNAMGVGKWRDEFSTYLQGADVVIIPDNDALGRQHADQVAQSVKRHAQRVRLLDLAKVWHDIEESDDVYDWFAAGHDVEELWRHVEALSDYRLGNDGNDDNDRPPPLTIKEWLVRDLPAPDFIMGNWLSTTTRGLLVGPTGLGKTNFALALTLHMAAGSDFLHWRGRRLCNVLYIDGEMSRRLFKQRIEDAVNRLGQHPTGFHALSHEDVENFAPLNTPAGQAYIERLIAQTKPDFIVFDAIMCLLAGEMKEGQSWAAVMPWVRSLTRRRIGQLWLHHTGHDENRSYGDKTKEWQLDTVLHMETLAREDADVSFALEFRKARERTPATRDDFQRSRIAILGDQWTVEITASVRPGSVSPIGQTFLNALHNALAGEVTEMRYGRRAVSQELWKAECFALGLLERDKRPNQISAVWSKYRLELIAANRIVCDSTCVWTI